MTIPKPMRINARLSAESARKVAYLRERGGGSTTDVVLAAIDRYFAAMTDEREAPAEILARAGFVACVDGPADLSRVYKSELTRSLGKKA